MNEGIRQFRPDEKADCEELSEYLWAKLCEIFEEHKENDDRIYWADLYVTAMVHLIARLVVMTVKTESQNKAASRLQDQLIVIMNYYRDHGYEE